MTHERHEYCIYIYRRSGMMGIIESALCTGDPLQLRALTQIGAALQHLLECEADHKCYLCNELLTDRPEVLGAAVPADNSPNVPDLVYILCDTHVNLSDEELSLAIATQDFKTVGNA